MLTGILFAVTSLVAVPAEPASLPDAEKPRVVIMPGVGGDSDDRQSLVRLKNRQVIFQVNDSKQGQAAADSADCDHAMLLVYRDAAGRERPVRTRGDWQRRREQILRGMQAAMGPLPDRSHLGPLDVKQLESVESDCYKRLTITFDGGEGDRIPAYLYLPTPCRPGNRRPAMLALHPTSPLGKGVVAGLSTRPNRGYAVELARRGYVVLAPDYPSFGDYMCNFQESRFASGTMKGIANHMRCVDLLASRDDVDPDRIGVIGHSLGGHNAMFVGVFDPRLKVIVSSCGWTPFHDYYGGKIAGWTSPRYMPRLKDAYGLDPDRVPFDFYEVVAALAPRVFFSCSPTHDDNFDVAGVRKAIAEARPVYQLLGAEENLQVHYPEAQHDFPLEVRLASYALIDKTLMRGLRVEGPAGLRVEGRGLRVGGAGSEVLQQQVARAVDGGRQASTPRPADPRKSPAASQRLFGGVAVVDITPPKGYRMSGYFSERLNTGVHDPLHAKAIYLRQGTQEMVLVECDIIAIAAGVAQDARRQASARTGIPAERILVAATHSHTGPLYFGALRNMLHARAVDQQGRDPHELVDYPAVLSARLVDVIARAQALQEPVTVDVAVGHAEGLAFNRRFHMQDGTVRFNPGKLNPNIVRPVGPIDPDVSILLLRRVANGHPLVSLTNFALHLDTVGGTQYGADYPFYLATSLRQEFGPSFVSLFATGTCGDLNHIDVSNSDKQHGQDEAQRIGTRLAEIVKQSLRNGVRVEPHVAGKAKVVSVPLQQYSDDEVAHAWRDLEKLGAGKLPFLKQVKAYAIASVSLRKESQLPLEVQAFRVADNVAIVGLPGEIFVELGLAIKRRSPFKTTMVIELCNDAPGYLPTRKAFVEGSYETVNSRIAPGGGEALVKAAVELLEALKCGV
jgi:neutral ceramidase